MKILLATPIATIDELWGQYAKGAGHYLPLGLLSIAGVCREAGFDVQLLDASTLGTTEEELLDVMARNRFDVIGLGSCYTALAHFVFRTVSICRSVLPDAKIMIGGVHPTLFPAETLRSCPQADFVCRGQGERTFIEFIQMLRSDRPDFGSIQGIAYRKAGRIHVTEERPYIVDPENLPMLPFDLIQMKKYVPPPSNYVRLPTYGLLATQGCPYQCVFCDTRVHGRKLRNHGTEKLIRTIKYLVDVYGMKGLLFHDSVFTIDKSFVEDFCQQLITNKLDVSWTCFTRVDCVTTEMLALMKRAGCWSISYGLESGNPESLKLIKKNTTIQQAKQAVAWTKKAGIQVIGSFILCLPGEDEQMTLRTIEFAKKLKLDTAVFFLPVPFPGTELYDLCQTDGGLAQNITWEQYRQWMDPVNPLYVNPKIGKKRMVELYDYAVRSFYTSPATVLRALMNIRSFSDIKKYITGFRSIVGILIRSFKKTPLARLSHRDGR